MYSYWCFIEREENPCALRSCRILVVSNIWLCSNSMVHTGVLVTGPERRRKCGDQRGNFWRQQQAERVKFLKCYFSNCTAPPPPLIVVDSLRARLIKPFITCCHFIHSKTIRFQFENLVSDDTESIKENAFKMCGKHGMLICTIFTALIYLVGLASMLVYAMYVSAHSPTLGFSHTVSHRLCLRTTLFWFSASLFCLCLLFSSSTLIPKSL